MEIYHTWRDYLASEQDAYLDEENCADCDVQTRMGEYRIYGQSNIGAYEVCHDGETVGIYVSHCLSADDQWAELLAALNEGGVCA